MPNITGYRTNEDYTETLAWYVKADGTVGCDHDPACCFDCVDCDGRLIRDPQGVTVVGYWPPNMVRVGRTVTPA